MNEDVLTAQVLFSPWSSKSESMQCLMTAVEEEAQQNFFEKKQYFPDCLNATFKREKKEKKQ